MDKPGFVSLDKSGVNKEAGFKDAMPDFAGFSAYQNPGGGAYLQDLPPPINRQENPDVRKAQAEFSSSTPSRYY